MNPQYSVCMCVHVCFFKKKKISASLKSKRILTFFAEIVRDFIWTIGYCANTGSAVILLKS